MESNQDLSSIKDKNSINSPEDNKNKNINIKYPFSGVATNLIDKFLVLGYEQKVIEYTFLHCENEEPKTDLKTRFRFFEFEE